MSTVILVLPTPANVGATPADPTGTASTTGVMMGLGVLFTPAASGKVEINIVGDVLNPTANDGSQMQIRYGTGTAPVNGAALTGTTSGSVVKVTNGNATGVLGVVFTPGKNSWSCVGYITGLTIGTAYWVDISLASISGGTSTARDISVDVSEKIL